MAEELGISIKTGSGSFTATTFTLKIECATIGESGIVLDKEAEEFKLLANSWGMKSEDLGRTVLINGESFEIKGASSRSWKFPIMVNNLKTGRGWKFPVKTVKRALGYVVTGMEE